MNVLQILPELRAGGVERGSVDLAKFLQKTGHKAIVVSAGGPMVNDLATQGITHYQLPVHKKNLFTILHSIKELSKIVKAEEIQVLHARSRVPALIAFFVSRRTNVPFVTTCHGFYSKHPLSAVMGWGKLVIVASHVIGKRMRDDFGVPFEKIRLIPRGVDLEDFALRAQTPTAKSGPLTIGLVGRITPIKGHPLFLKAMARVARVYPSIKIQIIGEAPKMQYKEELLLLTKRLGLSGCTEFLGTRYDVPELLSKMSILVVPSVGEEAFGRVAIEAGAMGVPVVATRIGGLIDIIDHEKNGLLVPPDDARLLADAVIDLLKNPQKADGFAKALREKVEKEFNLHQMFQKTLRVYEEALAKKKILIIKLSAVGDVILSIPSIRAVREKFKEATISVLVGRKSRKIIRNSPYVDDIFVYENTEAQERVPALLKTARLLAREDFDMVIDLQNNKTSRFLGFACGARIRAGHNNGKWSFLLSHKTKMKPGVSMPPVAHQFEVLKLLGIDSSDKRLELWTMDEEERSVKRLLESQWVSSSQTLVGINPGSSLRWPTKQWPLENFAKLCDDLARQNIRVVVTGAPEDAPLVDELMRQTKNKPINAVGKTSLTELVALIRRCQVFISSDSAPMHVASSVDTPLIAIFGPTDPKRHLVAPTRYQVFWKEVQCSPCYLRKCPIGHICMKKITVQEVLDSVLYFIREKKVTSAEKETAANLF